MFAVPVFSINILHVHVHDDFFGRFSASFFVDLRVRMSVFFVLLHLPPRMISGTL